MLLQITAKIESSGFVQEPFGIQAPPYIIDLGCDSENRIVELRAQKRVSLDEIRLTTMTLDAKNVMVVDFPLNQPHFADLLDLVQYVESIGSFWFGFSKLLWAEGKYEWLPETDEERAALRVFSTKTALSYPETRRHVELATFARAIAARSRLGHLTIPMAFFREAVNDYRSFRYVNAFQNLYFFIEGVFGEGKTRNKDVERQFASSPVLIDAIWHSMKALEQSERHKTKLDALRAARAFGWTPQEIIRLVVWMRGNLHHFSTRSTTPKGHPLNQREFESVAFLLQSICLDVVARIAR